MKEFRSGYYVNEDGELFSTRQGKLRKLKGRINKKGYRMYALRLGGITKDFSAHHLSYYVNVEPFDSSDGLQIDHMDGNKLNNNYENLRRVTPKENTNNPITKRNITGANNHRYREIDLNKLSELYLSGESLRSIARYFQCSRQLVTNRLSKLNLTRR